MAYEVVDNFLPEDQFKALQETMMGVHFPWYYNKGIAYEEDDNFQFIHNFYNHEKFSPFMPILKPLIGKINPSMLYRAKANLGIRTSTNQESGWHTDFQKEDLICKTAVFYINTNDGFTLFKDGEKVPSLENRFVVFDSPTVHTGVSQTNTDRRVLINLNFDL